jgi:hypothetical protein
MPRQDSGAAESLPGDGHPRGQHPQMFAKHRQRCAEHRQRRAEHRQMCATRYAGRWNPWRSNAPRGRSRRRGPVKGATAVRRGSAGLRRWAARGPAEGSRGAAPLFRGSADRCRRLAGTCRANANPREANNRGVCPFRPLLFQRKDLFSRALFSFLHKSGALVPAQFDHQAARRVKIAAKTISIHREKPTTPKFGVLLLR